MKFVRNCSTDPCYNMSFDEYCLEQVSSGDTFFCLWRDRPSVIIGLNQNAATEVNMSYMKSRGIVLARRATGGGAVYHDLQNLNYSIFRPLSSSSSVNGADAVSVIVSALREFGVPAVQGGRNDIYVEGRKVSGFARRVFKDRELVHGTLMYNVDIETLTDVLDIDGSKLHRKGVASVRSRVANLKDYLPQFDSLDSFQAALQEYLQAGDSEIFLSEEQKNAVQALSDSKYSTPYWILNRVRDEGSDAL